MFHFFTDASLIGNYDIKRCYKVNLTFHYQINGGLTSSTIINTRLHFSSLFRSVSGLLSVLPQCSAVTITRADIINSPPGVKSIFFRIPLILTASKRVADYQVPTSLVNCINAAKSTGNKAMIDAIAPRITQNSTTYGTYNASISFPESSFPLTSGRETRDSGSIHFRRAP